MPLQRKEFEVKGHSNIYDPRRSGCEDSCSYENCNSPNDEEEEYDFHLSLSPLDDEEEEPDEQDEILGDENFHDHVSDEEVTIDKLYKCTVCQKHFKLAKALMAHLRTHVRKRGLNFKCSLCKTKFRDACELKGHLLRVHLRMKSVECLECGKLFFSQSNMTEHARRKHTKHMDEDEEKPFLCPKCGKAFKFKSAFNNHRKYVHGLARWHCAICGTSYKHKKDLNKHASRQHTKQ